MKKEKSVIIPPSEEDYSEKINDDIIETEKDIIYVDAKDDIYLYIKNIRSAASGCKSKVGSKITTLCDELLEIHDIKYLCEGLIKIRDLLKGAGADIHYIQMRDVLKNAVIECNKYPGCSI